MCNYLQPYRGRCSRHAGTTFQVSFLGKDMDSRAQRVQGSENSGLISYHYAKLDIEEALITEKKDAMQDLIDSSISKIRRLDFPVCNIT